MSEKMGHNLMGKWIVYRTKEEMRAKRSLLNCHQDGMDSMAKKKLQKLAKDCRNSKPDWTCKCGIRGDLTAFEELQMVKGERKRCLCGKLARISQDAWERIHGR